MNRYLGWVFVVVLLVTPLAYAYRSDQSLYSPESMIYLLLFIGAFVFIALRQLTRILPKLFSMDRFTQELGSRKFRQISIGITSLLVVVSLGLTFYLLDKSYKTALTSTEDKLNLVLDSTEGNIKSWMDERQRMLFQLGRDPLLVAITKNLLSTPVDQQTLVNSPFQTQARAFFKEREADFGSKGFFIINKKGMSIGSRRDSNLGSFNYIVQKRPGLMQNVFDGRPTFIPPIHTDLVGETGSYDISNVSSALTMFFAVPIRDADGTVLAVLTQRLTPYGVLSLTMHKGQIGESGESYLVNRLGEMVTQSRFIDPLLKIGLIKPNSTEPLLVKNPGGNMLEGYRSNKPIAEQPFTLPAQDIIDQSLFDDRYSSEIMSNLEGYRDYRGVLVYGKWKWIPTLEMGIVTEINVKEALMHYDEIKFELLLVVFITLLLSIISTLFSVLMAKQMTRSLQKSKDELEGKVKARTAELTKIQATFMFAVEGAGDGLWDWNMPDNNMQFSNLYMSMLGYAEFELPHHAETWLNSVHPDDIARTQQELLNYQEGRIPLFAIEVRLRCKDGRYKWILCRGTIIERDEVGKPMRMIGIHSDISARKKNEFELIAARDEAEHANLVKSQFLSSMSHELRTPLNAIIGFSQLFEYENNLSQDLKDNAHEIYSAGNHLLSLINDVLNLAQIESGAVELNMEAVSLHKVLQESHILMMSTAQAHGIKVTLFPAETDGIYVKADYTRLKQILLNLMSNAVKYNRNNGVVSINCRVTDANVIRISINDTGNGISKENLDKLFIPFNRLGAECSTVEGTGIGLVITQDLIKLMGGHIGVNSVVGEGTTFWVELNQAFPKMLSDSSEASDLIDSASKSNKPSSSQANILVAEDNLPNQLLLQQFLKILGLRCDIADNGLEAWKRWQEGRYDLLLTDITMPLMDGYELVEKIRQAEQRTGAHMPIIAITANAMAEDVKRCLEGGMDAFISKPIKFQELKTLSEQWLPIDGYTSENNQK